MDARLQKVIEVAQEALDDATGRPGTVLSPDGWGEREARAELARDVLEAAGVPANSVSA